MKRKTIWLIDIDGTVCEDIPNEQSHLFIEAKPLHGSLEKVLELHNRGDRITFFTARTEEHKDVTELWLTKHGFPFEKVVYGKPRIGEKEDYHWVDNKSVFASFLPEGLR